MITINSIIFIIAILSIPIFWGLSDGYRIKNPELYAETWHKFKYVVHIMIGILVYVNTNFLIAFWFSIYFWLIFDICVNLARGLPLLTKGTINFFDRLFPTEKSQLITKIISLLVISILNLIF